MDLETIHARSRVENIFSRRVILSKAKDPRTAQISGTVQRLFDNEPVAGKLPAKHEMRTALGFFASLRMTSKESAAKLR